ncbi:MAG: ATP-binding protein, partial [Bryobacteraceae bacterium]
MNVGTMMGHRYNPFSKPLLEFPPEELAVLRDVSEGWFVDYKSQPLSPRDFGKHLSAFANQFGGWLFVGISEGPNKNLKAESFPGIPSSEVPAALLRIREGVSVHVSPPVYFEHRVIDGPIDTIGLEAGRSIIVVAVGEGPNPPFVHSSGRIYRRIADSSEPKAETDRAVLDGMWRKSENLRGRLRHFIFEPTEDPRTQNTYCYVYFMEDLTFSLPEYQLNFAGFQEAIKTETPDPSMSITLDNIYTTQDGFIARHLMFNNDPLYELTSLRWWHTGNVRLTIPINYIQSSQHSLIQDTLYKRFAAAMGNQLKAYRSILNMDQWLVALVTLVGRYLHLRDKVNSDYPIYGKVIFSNARLRTPFIGMESFLGSPQEFVTSGILRGFPGFLKSDVFGVGHGYAPCFQQEV